MWENMVSTVEGSVVGRWVLNTPCENVYGDNEKLSGDEKAFIW